MSKKKLQVWDKPQVGGVYKEEKPGLWESLLRLLREKRKDKKE